MALRSIYSPTERYNRYADTGTCSERFRRVRCRVGVASLTVVREQRLGWSASQDPGTRGSDNYWRLLPEYVQVLSQCVCVCVCVYFYNLHVAHVHVHDIVCFPYPMMLIQLCNMVI